MHSLRAIAGGFLILISANASALALDGKAILAEKCMSCHNVRGPAPGTYAELLQRKAPDLFYAGSKFNRDWLVNWLQKPTPIRPAGVMFLDHIAVQDGKDTLDKASIKPCPANLGAEEAAAVAYYLMTLTSPGMKTGVVDPDAKFSQAKARRMFSKQYPCIACHTATLGKNTYGGVSGPDLTEAGDRLNPDWIFARIKDPQHWDPKTWMPKFEMSDQKRELLAQFVASMKK